MPFQVLLQVFGAQKSKSMQAHARLNLFQTKYITKMLQYLRLDEPRAKDTIDNSVATVKLSLLDSCRDHVGTLLRKTNATQ
jgi:hypothetical protein